MINLNLCAHQEISKTSGTTATPSKNVEQILTVPVTESLVNEDANLSKKSTHNLSTSNTSMCLRSRRLLNGSAQRTLTNNRNTGGVAHANVDEDADAKCVSWPRKVPNRGQAFLASNSKSLGITIPQSPMLTTKVRASTRMLTRQTSSVVSKEQTLKRKIGKKPKSRNWNPNKPPCIEPVPHEPTTCHKTEPTSNSPPKR